MNNIDRKISLGFTAEKFYPGVHICQIFTEDDERHETLINFVLSGVQTGENTACFSDKESEENLTDFLEKQDVANKDGISSGKFSFNKAKEVYFEGGKFEPERMLVLLQQFYEKAVEQKQSGARVIGEMSPDIEKIEGGSRLLEYESKVSLLLKKYPVNAVCQYDARSFDGATIMNVLKVHPYMIVKGSIVRNPFYIPPEEFLSMKR